MFFVFCYDFENRYINTAGYKQDNFHKYFLREFFYTVEIIKSHCINIFYLARLMPPPETTTFSLNILINCYNNSNSLSPCVLAKHDRITTHTTAAIWFMMLLCIYYPSDIQRNKHTLHNEGTAASTISLFIIFWRLYFLLEVTRDLLYVDRPTLSFVFRKAFKDSAQKALYLQALTLAHKLRIVRI